MTSPTDTVDTFLKLYTSLSPRSDPFTWTGFWESLLSHSPTEIGSTSGEIAKFYTQTLSRTLSTLSQDHPQAQKFLRTLPLRYSKTILSWPPSPDILYELMSD